MKVGINLLDLYPGKIGGMEQYIRNIIYYVEKKSEYELILFLNEHNYETFKGNSKRILINIQKNREHQLYNFIEDLNIDIWFCPLLNLEPRYVNIPTMVTIPDVQHDFFPEYFTKEVLEFRHKNYLSSMQKADVVVTISEFSKQTIINKYDIDENKIKVVYLDADKSFYNDNDIKINNKVKEELELPEQYTYYPSNTWPHKNHLKLLEGFKYYKNEYKDNLKLVFTGDKKKFDAKIQHFIKKNNLDNDIIYLGYVPQEYMQYIYRNAKFMSFPSLFEGFCIPVVEAMRVECPVICSDKGSIPEIAGESVLYFNPLDPKDIAEKMAKMMCQEEIRKKYIKLGSIRKNKFSWQKSALETIDIFDELYINSCKVDKFPLVSVITPSFNQGRFIKDTIESVLNQDYPNIEYIVMDGGSTDETVEILKSFGNKIKWISEKDNGQADAVNKGVKLAKGEIIGWLNSDDTYLDNAISKGVRFLTSHSDVGMVYGEGYYTDIDGNIVDRYLTEPFNYNRLAENCIICQPTGFIRKKVFEDVGYLDESLHLCMDYEMWMRIGKHTQVAYIPQYIATSRMYEENKTLGRRTEVFEEVCRTVKKYYKYVPLSWLYGYSDYICEGKRSIKFTIILFCLFIKYNITNISYASRLTINLLKKKIKQRIKPATYTDRYEDGWVSKVFSFNNDVKKETNKIVLKGKHLWPYDDSLKIKIMLNGKKIGEVEIKEKGQFIKEVDFPKNQEGKINFQLLANNVFCPKKLGINNDIRNLAYIIDEIEFI
ncbi:glycosyltransferase [Vallitalea okinawensis]|uniref:glycosyltransferase n=1 Tax=Vallitalea okinawensis TaxID=2078660 RepID=UPI000CFDC871|nr:glycosyltransferase [Vallitalea okinawensis]